MNRNDAALARAKRTPAQKRWASGAGEIAGCKSPTPGVWRPRAAAETSAAAPPPTPPAPPPPTETRPRYRPQRDGTDEGPMAINPMRQTASDSPSPIDVSGVKETTRDGRGRRDQAEETESAIGEFAEGED